MASKKQLLESISEESVKIQNTERFFKEKPQEETKEEPKQEERVKRSYTHFTHRETKKHTVTMRLTDKQYEELLKQVEKTKSGTITNYIMSFLERGNK